MNKHLVLLAAILSAIILQACHSKDEPDVPDTKIDQTVIMFFPWSNNLKSEFVNNINDFSTTITREAITKERVYVCIESTPGTADVIELKYKDGGCVQDTIRTYSSPEFTTQDGISTMLTYVKSLSKSDRYSLIIGCHGMGWLPISRSRVMTSLMHYDENNGGGAKTRYFGGTSVSYQIEIETLAKAIEAAQMKMEYILFDDCYMSSIELAYELRDVTDYLIASPNEIMAYGFPYHKVGKYLIGNVNYEKVTEEFYDFYSTYEYPYGTIAVTKCSELENLAHVAKQINNSNPNAVSHSDVQVMDGYSPTIFFDYGDMMTQRCSSALLLDEFENQMARTVVYKRNTPKFYTNVMGARDINTFSGLTTSELSNNTLATTVSETAWYIASH
jgi:hypothetical protein